MGDYDFLKTYGIDEAKSDLRVPVGFSLATSAPQNYASLLLATDPWAHTQNIWQLSSGGSLAASFTAQRMFFPESPLFDWGHSNTPSYQPYRFSADTSPIKNFSLSSNLFVIGGESVANFNGDMGTTFTQPLGGALKFIGDTRASSNFETTLSWNQTIKAELDWGKLFSGMNGTTTFGRTQSFETGHGKWFGDLKLFDKEWGNLMINGTLPDQGPASIRAKLTFPLN